MSADTLCEICNEEYNMKTRHRCTPKRAVNMNNDSKIITGLRLSEAIKYCEENPDALISASTMVDGFAPVKDWQFTLNETWSVKLPPPKSVSVTRTMAEEAYDYACEPFGEFKFENFVKKLGL